MLRRIGSILVVSLLLALSPEALAAEQPKLSEITTVCAVAHTPVEHTATRVLSTALSKAADGQVGLGLRDSWANYASDRRSVCVSLRRHLPGDKWAAPLRAVHLTGDGYALRVIKGSLWIVSDSPRGLLYGAYELLDRLGIPTEPGEATLGESILSPFDTSPAFSRRCLGTGYWEFLSEDSLRSLFRSMSYQRLNGFVAFMSLTNYADLKPFKDLWGDPLGHVLEYRDYPKLQWREQHETLIEESTKHLNRLIDLAEEYGIDVYVGTWEIGYPTDLLSSYPELASPTPMSASNPQTEIYVRSRFRELASRFPRIKGVFYNGTESHSYVTKSETLPAGKMISSAERTRLFTTWATEALREVIPDSILVVRNGPAAEVRDACYPGTVYCPNLVDGLYYQKPPLPEKPMDDLGPVVSPMPQGIAVDETSEYRGQNAFLLANIYGWSSRIAPTYRRGGFNELLLGFTRTIPGSNPSGSYGLDVMNDYCLGQLAWDPLADPDKILRSWARRFFPSVTEEMYGIAARSPEVFLEMWRKADYSGWTPRAPWFNYTGLTSADVEAKELAFRSASEDVAAFEAVAGRLSPTERATIGGYMRSRARYADFVWKVALTDMAATEAMKNNTPDVKSAVDSALRACQETADRLDFPPSPWVDFRGHVSSDFARHMFYYYATQIRWFSDPRLEVLTASQPLCSDPPRNVMGIKAVSASDQYFNSAMQLIDQVVSPTLDGQRVEPSQFSHPWITGPGWPQGVVLEFVRNQEVESLALHHTNVKSATVYLRLGDKWSKVETQVKVLPDQTTFSIPRQQAGAVALVIGRGETDGSAPRATELTWSPVEQGGLTGRDLSSCKYYHIRD